MEKTEEIGHRNGEEVQTDYSLQELLQMWKLMHISDFLNAENITIDVFKLMTKDDLFQLADKLKFGDKVMFKYHFQKWRRNISFPITLASQKLALAKSENTFSPSAENIVQITALDILKDHKIGLQIIQSYEKSLKLTDKDRVNMIDIIVHYFHSKSYDLTLQQSYQLEKDILKLFPTEKLEYYRTERQGKIYTKYQNKKQFSKSNSSICYETQSESQKSSNLPASEENAEIYVQSLRIDHLSAKDFRLAWSACSKFRLNQITKESKTIKEAFKLWPQYKRVNGFQLIDIDYNNVNKQVSMFDWDVKFKKLYNYTKTKLRIRDPLINYVLNSINTNEFAKDNNNSLKILWCLHSHLYSTKKISRKDINGKKETGRYTIKNSQESFIYINETRESLTEHIDSLSRKCEPIQPFILGVGNPKTVLVKNFIVYLDGHLMSFKYFHRALDICFKSFHVFNVKYPAASQPFWEFIQIYLYEMTNINTSAKVNRLVDELTKM